MKYLIVALLFGCQYVVQAVDHDIELESTFPERNNNIRGAHVDPLDARHLPIQGHSPVPVIEPRTIPSRLEKKERSRIQGHSPVPVIEQRTKKEVVRISPEHPTRTRLAPGPLPFPGEVSATIVNGTRVTDVNAKYPFMVHSAMCGASLIAPNVLLSAAHCQGEIQNVFLGLNNVDHINSGTEEYESFTILEEVIHPDFINTNDEFDYDFMVLKMSGSSAKTPVVLDRGEVSLDPGKRVIVMGWGLTRDQGELSNVLMEVEVEIKNHQDCLNSYSDMTRITDRHICASLPGKDSCNGDSGGPIIDKDTQKQIGIVSFGNYCNDPLHPGVYSKIQNQIDWIQKYIDEWSGDDLTE